MRTDPSELLALADSVVGSALPGEAVEAYLARSTTTTVRAYDGEVESLTTAEVSGIGVRVITGQRMGFSHAAGFDLESALDCLVEARDNARFAQPDEYVGLVDEATAGSPGDIDRWSETLAQLPREAKITAALRLEELTRAADARISGVRTAVYSDMGGESALVATTGLRRWTRANRCGLSVVALADDGDSDATVGWANDSARDLDSLDVAAMAELAAGRATGLLGATKPHSGEVAIVLEPRLAATLLGTVAGMLSGDRLLKGRTPFAGRIGEDIASPGLRLFDDPTDDVSLGATGYDGEGVASEPVALIEGGVLRGFLHNTYTGRRCGGSTTASAIRGYRSTPGVGCRALHVGGGAGDLESLTSGVDNGVLVQSMTGLHSGVNAVSGDFSVGVEGFAVNNGVVGGPVKEATIAGSVQRMLADIAAIGADVTYLPGGAVVPSLVVEGVSLSGI